MRGHRSWLILALVPVFALSGCAKLNEWLEGTVGEEEKKSGTTPEEELLNQSKALKGTVPADRKAAIGKLMAIKAKDAPDIATQARTLVIGLIDDADSAVAKEAMSALQTLTGFAEKTEDERQLDPEGYDQQLKGKEQVVAEGLTKLAAAVRGTDAGLRYGALIVIYNLTRAPVVPANASTLLQEQAAAAVSQVALDETAELDTRLLGIEALAALGAATEIAKLLPLLGSSEAALRARVALALGQAGAGLGAAQGEASQRLAALAADPSQGDDLRWQALLALGRLGTDQTAAMDRPFTMSFSPEEAADLSESEQMSPLEAYRAYALAHATSPEAAQKLAAETQKIGQMATKAEEELAAERKKGYR